MAMIPLFDLITSSNNIGYFCMCTSCLYLTSENTNYLSKYREMDGKKDNTRLPDVLCPATFFFNRCYFKNLHIFALTLKITVTE